MEDLLEKMKVYLASNFAFYLKMHNFHWNVEGPHFSEYHEFFGDLYNDLWSAQDDIAEHIRALGAYAPGSFERYKDLSRIPDQTELPVEAAAMFNIAMADNYEMITIIYEAYKAAETAGEIGLSNFLQDRMVAHKKHGWMLRATAKLG